MLSKALGSRTVMSGSISKGKNDPSQSLQMIERPLMTADELKSIPKGHFVVMKTGTHPMQTRLRCFWNGVSPSVSRTRFQRSPPRKVAYASKRELERAILQRHHAQIAEEAQSTQSTPLGGMAQVRGKRPYHGYSSDDSAGLRP